jgi:hypothetical protein
LAAVRPPPMRPSRPQVPLRVATAAARTIAVVATANGATPAAAVVAVVMTAVRVKAKGRDRVRAPGLKATVRPKAMRAIARMVRAEAKGVVVVAIAAAAAAIAVNSMVVRSPAVAVTPRRRIEFALANRVGWRAFEASAFADAFFVLGPFVSPVPLLPRTHASYG